VSSDNKHQKRDAETNIALGGFIALLSIAVLAGTLFAESSHARVVNAIAGLILLAVGAGFLLTGMKAHKKLD